MLRWLFVDLNSYFASVEQQLRPELRKKPMAVVPMLVDTTCCIAASYEAKRFGVKTGTIVTDARKMCPGIQFVEARHEAYVKYHEKIVEAVESCLPVTSVMSIDEMACRLTGRDQNEANAIGLGKEVKKKILKVGSELTSSVGIGPNRLISKMASDMQKPDGLTIIHEEDLPQRFLPLKLSDFPGIGFHMEKRLSRQGIFTVENLYALDEKQMRNIWGGVGGERFFRWIRGEDFEISHSENRSIGHEHVLEPKFRNEKASYAVTQRLLHKAAARLRKINSWTTGLSLNIRFVDKTRWGDDIRMLECQDTLTLLETLKELWKRKPKGNPLKVAVTLFGLIPDHERTFSFFDNPKRVKLSSALDTINVKYGKNTIYFGGVHDVLTSAPTRIAFSSIPDLEI